MLINSMHSLVTLRIYLPDDNNMKAKCADPESGLMNFLVELAQSKENSMKMTLMTLYVYKNKIYDHSICQRPPGWYDMWCGF